MPRYMITVSYTSEAMGGMVKNPQDRAAAFKPAVEAVGGKLEALYFAFGEDDAFAIYEAPDNTAAAALAMAVAAGGGCRAARTTVLMTPQEAQQAMAKASATGYKPPS
jgi:uncharacterized protein with GYD domain